MNKRLNQLKEMLHEDSTDSFLLFAIAKEYDVLERYDKSIAHFEQLKDLDPNYVGLYYHLAHVYIKIEDLESAMKIFDLGISVANNLADHHALAELKNAKLNLEMGL